MLCGVMGFNSLNVLSRSRFAVAGLMKFPSAPESIRAVAFPLLFISTLSLIAVGWSVAVMIALILMGRFGSSPSPIENPLEGCPGC